MEYNNDRSQGWTKFERQELFLQYVRPLIAFASLPCAAIVQVVDSFVVFRLLYFVFIYRSRYLPGRSEASQGKAVAHCEVNEAMVRQLC